MDPAQKEGSSLEELSMGIDGISITKLYIYSCLFTIIHYMITSLNVNIEMIFIDIFIARDI